MRIDHQLSDDGKLVFTLGLRVQTQPRRGWTGRLREASAERAVVLGCPPERALPYVWDIRNVERCERKADRVSVEPETSSTGRYVIRGRIFGVMPWEGQFRYVLHEAGFHCQDAVPRRGGLRVKRRGHRRGAPGGLPDLALRALPAAVGRRSTRACRCRLRALDAAPGDARSRRADLWVTRAPRGAGRRTSSPPASAKGSTRRTSVPALGRVPPP